MTYILELHIRKPSKIGSIQREFFEDTYAAVQRSLACFPFATATNIIKTMMYYRQDSWRLAAYICFNTAIRCWDKATELMKTLVDQLVSSLRVSDICSMWTTHPEVILWILFMGSCAAWNKIDRGWLLLELRHGIRHLDIHSVDEFEGLMKSLLYRESIFRCEIDLILSEIA